MHHAIRPRLSSSCSSRVRRALAVFANTLAASLVLTAVCPSIASAGNDSDESYEDIENSFVDDYDGGYSWSSKSVTRDGVTDTIEIAHDIRGEPNIWDINGSFFENSTNRKRYVSKMQEWGYSDYLADNPSDSDMVATNYLLYNADGSENDVLSTWIYVEGTEIKEVQADFVSEELIEGVILSPFTSDTTIKFKFKYDPAFTGSKTKTCTVNVQPDADVYARSIAIKMDTGDWWTGDGAGCSIELNKSWGGEIELHADWEEDLCINSVGNQSGSGSDMNAYNCDNVTETWRYGSDMKIHASWDEDLCLNHSGTNFWGGNVNLYNCDYAEEFYFGDDDILHMVSDPDYCVNALQSGVAWDESPTNLWGGTGLNIYHCDWVIDGWDQTEL